MDESARMRKQKRAVEIARQRRAARRKAQHDAWDAAQRASRGEGGLTPITPFTPSPLMPIGAILEDRVRQLAVYLSLVEYDPTISLPEKTRLEISAIPALARGCDSLELRERIETLESELRTHHDDNVRPIA